MEEDTREKALSFAEMAKLEPDLLLLEEHVKVLKYKGRKSSNYCANKLWYQEVRPWLSGLVGCAKGFAYFNIEHEPRVEKLRTVSAYHTCQFYLLGLLSPCRKCDCLGSHKYKKRNRNSNCSQWKPGEV